MNRLVLFVVLAAAGCARTELFQECRGAEECGAADACSVAMCEAGRCVQRAAPEGTACNDGLFCTTNDVCSGGLCGGSARDCGALDSSCTTGQCDESARACRAIASGVATGEGPFGVATCSDNLDNDCDGATDANDADCFELDWWNTAYPTRYRITIDATSFDELTDFPISVRFSGLVAADVGTMRFIADDQATELPFDAERAPEGYVIWVRIPRIEAFSAQGTFWAYTGGTVRSPLAAADVWSNGFGGVWHMTRGSSGDVLDASGHGKHGTVQGTLRPSTTNTGDGLYFDGLSGIRVPSRTDDDIFALRDAYTLEAWIHSDGGPPTWGMVMGRQRGSEADDAYYIGERRPEGGPVNYTMRGRAIARTTSQLPRGDGCHFAGVQSQLASAVYLAGELGTTVANQESFTLDINDVIIGAAENGPDTTLTEGFIGTIDEARISTVARSPDWIAASAATMDAVMTSVAAPEHL